MAEMGRAAPKAEKRLGGLVMLYGAYSQNEPAEEPNLYCVGVYIPASTCLIIFPLVLQYSRTLLAGDQSDS